MTFPFQNPYGLPKRETEDDSSFPLTSSETDFSPSTLFHWLRTWAILLHCVHYWASFLEGNCSWRKVLGIAQCLDTRIPRGFFFFLLVLTANIIGTLMIPEGCGDLCSFLQELDCKLLWTSQFSVWFSVLWVLLAAWLSNLVIHLFIAFLEQLWFIIQKHIITYFHECWGGNGNIERYLKDEMWGRNSSC